MTDTPSPTPLACPICSLQQTVGEVPGGARVHCARCAHLLFHDTAGAGNRRAFSFALTALLLFVPANVYPRLDLPGHDDQEQGERLERTRLYLAIEKIGRLSMLDVYVISLIVAVMSLGALASARAEIGALAFASVVIVMMIAARNFDPRLIWTSDRDLPSGD